MKKVLFVLATILLCGDVNVFAAKSIVLHAEETTYEIDPSSLAVAASDSSGTKFHISDAVITSTEVLDLQTTEGGAEWRLQGAGVRLAVKPVRGTLEFSVRPDSLETSFTWPVQSPSRDGAKAIIWPRGEGSYVPLDDELWRSQLIESQWDTLEGLSMPFWGFRTNGGTVSCVVGTPYHNTIVFSEPTSGSIILRFTHLFQRGEPQMLTFRIRLTPNASPIQPALDYRDWLIESGQFKSLQDKIREVPATEKLVGAAQIYLWGGGVLTRFDLQGKKANEFARKLVKEAASETSSPGKRIRPYFGDKQWASVLELAESDYKLPYAQSLVFEVISGALTRSDFFDEECWREVKLSSGVLDKLRQPHELLTEQDLLGANCEALHAAYSDVLPPVDQWGGAFSPKMLSALKEAGVDRARIGLPDVHSVTASGHGNFVQNAVEAGYLIGPYDSYHSIHDPKHAGTDASWPTAQFDQHLYETGAITRRDGTRYKGFQQRGYLLSPMAARPYVKRRVRSNFLSAPFNYYFFDCDGFGQVFDDYSPQHPATQMSDAAARCERLEWVAKSFGAPVGTEGGSSYAASAVALFEGVFGENFGWGEPLMKNRDSTYYPGGYYPPEAPAVFFKPVPAMPKFVHLLFNARYRLPLWETTFHDSVISTHHWSAASLKFSNVETTVSLTEMLYQCPPLYHLNPEEFAKRKDLIVRQYKAFSPLHRITATLPLSDFQWLNKERTVQKTTFGTRVEIVANFSEKPFDYAGSSIPAGGLMSVIDGKQAVAPMAR